MQQESKSNSITSNLCKMQNIQATSNESAQFNTILQFELHVTGHDNV